LKKDAHLVDSQIMPIRSVSNDQYDHDYEG